MARRKSNGKIRTVAELVKSYNPDHRMSPSERLADFLNTAATVLPKRFVDRRFCAMIAFAKKRIPGEESDDVKKRLPNIMTQTKRILKREPYEKDLHTDRVDGIRGTVNDEDVVVTTHRNKRRRVLSAIKSLEETDSLVDSRNTKGEIRKELLRARKAQASLLEYRDAVPLLKPAKTTVDG